MNNERDGIHTLEPLVIQPSTRVLLDPRLTVHAHVRRVASAISTSMLGAQRERRLEL